MIPKDQIKRIIEEAVHAPSGDNSQPWKFRVNGNKIDILGILGRDATLYNFEHRGDLIAHGAIIENIRIIASRLGYEAELVLFPVKNDATHTATVEIKERATPNGSIIEHGSLRDAIGRRCTNRKPYKKESITEDQKNEIIAVPKEIGSGRIVVVDNRSKIDELAKIASINERLLLENKHIHGFLFSIIRWTDEEEKKHPGMHIKTFELAPPQRAVFRLLKKWGVVKLLKKIGMSTFIAKENAKVYAASGAIIAIVMDDDTPESFVSAGRIFQRTWLTLTRMCLSLQPLAAVPYLAQRVEAGATQELSEEHVELIREADANLRKVMGIPNGTIAMVARIGNGGNPSAHSFKLPPVVE